jgi:hypothetical protein
MNDNKHYAYEAYAEKWFKTRAACEGQSAVHKAGEKFLPRLTEQTDNDYRSYKMRATYFNATGRTLDGLVGMIFRKEMRKNYPAAMESVLQDLDLAGNSLETVAMLTINDILMLGRAGILVEYPRLDFMPENQAQVEQLNLRPYTTYYAAESILDWRVERVNNVMQPVMIKLAEKYEIKKNEFECETKEQIRALLLTDVGYTQRIYRKNAKKEWYQEGDDIVPLMRGRPIPFIPFWAFGAKENSLTLQDPPILDLADVNLAHYRISADYERGCHFAGLPTPMLAGFTFDENASVAIGSSSAIISADPSAKWGFLEFTGQGLGALKENLVSKENQMAALGSRILAPEKAGVESEGALILRHSGEHSVLSAIVKLAGENFQNIMKFMAEWMSISGDIQIEFNNDFMPVPMSAQQLDSLMKAWQVGGIPQEELFYALKRGEIIRNSTNYDDYLDELSTDNDSAMSGVADVEIDESERANIGLISNIRTRLGL